MFRIFFFFCLFGLVWFVLFLVLPHLIIYFAYAAWHMMDIYRSLRSTMRDEGDSLHQKGDGVWQPVSLRKTLLAMSQ